MQSSRYWVERAFQDAKGYCGMAEYIKWGKKLERVASSYGIGYACDAYFVVVQDKINMYPLQI